MKKILVVLFVAAVGMSSCKKEETATPVKSESKVAAGAPADVKGWD